MTYKTSAPKEGTISLSKEDKKLLQAIGSHVSEQLRQLESFKKTFESAKEIKLIVRGGNVALQVRGLAAHETVFPGGDFACWRDPPGICEPGPCPEDLI